MDIGKQVLSEEGRSETNELSRVEVFSDASYASSNLKSFTGIVVCVGGTPIAWHTTRQAFVTLSTAEAELMSMLESPGQQELWCRQCLGRESN